MILIDQDVIHGIGSGPYCQPLDEMQEEPEGCPTKGHASFHPFAEGMVLMQAGWAEVGRGKRSDSSTIE